MRILLVVATIEEIGLFISYFGISISELKKNGFSGIIKNKSKIEIPKSEVLVTGVGMAATAFALGKHLAAKQYGLAINLGIAGSFDRNIKLGELVEISHDTFADFGAEDDTEFLPGDKMGLGDATYYPTIKLSAVNPPVNNFGLKTARAITVNTVHGNQGSIKKVSDRLNPQIESMEGAAFFTPAAK